MQATNNPSDTGSSTLIRVISDNDMHVIMAQFLSAAEDLHTAMCRFDDGHPAQSYLNNAMHAILIGAEQCRQLHSRSKFKIASDDDEE